MEELFDSLGVSGEEVRILGRQSRPGVHWDLSFLNPIWGDRKIAVADIDAIQPGHFSPLMIERNGHSSLFECKYPNEPLVDGVIRALQAFTIMTPRITGLLIRGVSPHPETMQLCVLGHWSPVMESSQEILYYLMEDWWRRINTPEEVERWRERVRACRARRVFSQGS